MKLGHKDKKQVSDLQIKLTHYSLGRLPLLIDGDFGRQTDFVVRQFQKTNKLVEDGIAGKNTMSVLNELTKDKFCLSLHGGHGGFDPLTNEYATLPSTGKRYHHASAELHKNGWFYEGVENRIAANALAEKMRKLGIFVLVTHHHYKCDYRNLGTHSNQTAPYVKAGYSGGTLSLHSNAVSTKDRTQAQIDAIQGCYIFTTPGLTYSDHASKLMLQELKNKFGDWVKLRDRKAQATERSDVEANFQVLREAEAIAAKYKNPNWFACLIENGFFTSLPDCLKIIESREEYVQCLINSILKIKNYER